MPPKSKLNPQAIADMTQWVQMGLPWPDDLRGSSKGPGQDRAAAGAKATLGISAGFGSCAAGSQSEGMAPDVG